MKSIRAVTKEDLPFLKKVIDSTGLFPSELLDEMTSTYFSGDAVNEHWLTVEIDVPIAVAYFAPERLTNGTYNLYLIAVHAEKQGLNIGRELMTYIENLLLKEGNRILIVETSGLSVFERTRAFYRSCNYTEEARIRDFYAEGEDKVIFWKSLKENQN